MTKYDFMIKMLSDKEFTIVVGKGKDFEYLPENETKEDLIGDIYCRLLFEDLNVSGLEDEIVINHCGPCVPAVIREAYNKGYHKHTSFEDYSKDQLIDVLQKYLEFKANQR